VGAVRGCRRTTRAGDQSLVRGRPGSAARRDDAGLAARLPRAAFPAQPPAVLSQTALRAVRLVTMAGALAGEPIPTKGRGRDQRGYRHAPNNLSQGP
jgi:hypothetical protein